MLGIPAVYSAKQKQSEESCLKTLAVFMALVWQTWKIPNDSA